MELEDSAIINLRSGDTTDFFTYNPNSKKFYLSNKLNIETEITIDIISGEKIALKQGTGGYLGANTQGIINQQNQFIWKSKFVNDTISLEYDGLWIGINNTEIILSNKEFYWNIVYVKHGDAYMTNLCVGTKLESKECMNYCAETNNCINALNSFCGTPGNITTSVCQNACRTNIHVNCDNSLITYCASAVLGTNTSETIINTCACHMGESFYKNMSNTLTPILNTTVSSSRAMLFMPSCLNDNAIKTFEIKNLLSSPSLPYTCIKELYFDNSGIVNYANVSNSSDCVNYKPSTAPKKIKSSENNELKLIVGGSVIAILILLLGGSIIVRVGRKRP